MDKVSHRADANRKVFIKSADLQYEIFTFLKAYSSIIFYVLNAVIKILHIIKIVKNTDIQDSLDKNVVYEAKNLNSDFTVIYIYLGRKEYGTTQ